jgi:hypothetical protein
MKCHLPGYIDQIDHLIHLLFVSQVSFLEKNRFLTQGLMIKIEKKNSFRFLYPGAVPGYGIRNFDS